MKEKCDLSFEDFDYNKVKALLPKGYEPIPYLPVEIPAPEKLIKITGFSTEQEAVNRVQELCRLCPSNNYQIMPNSIIIKDYNIVIPERCSSYLRKTETIVKENNPIVKVNSYEPYLYRFFDNKQYEDNFFKKGELLLSTFNRCKTKEVKNRQDKYENRNKVIVQDGNTKIEIDIEFHFDTLLFCTSLSQKNLNIHDNMHNYGFKINNPTAFLDILTRALVTKGIKVGEILKGPCVYNNKQIVIDAAKTNIIKIFLDKTNQNELNFNSVMQFIQKQAQNHIMMNKPINFANENEYRFIWLLQQPIKKEDVADDVTINDDGSIIINIPELTQFCERL